MTKPRTTRDEETRDMELMDEWNFQYANPFDLPEGVYRDGYSYHWARTSVRGIVDNRLEELMRNGWKLVPQDRTTSQSLDPLGRNPLSKDYICTFDTILMERPEIFKKREEEARNKRTEDITRSLPGIGYTDLDKKMTTYSRRPY